MPLPGRTGEAPQAAAVADGIAAPFRLIAIDEVDSTSTMAKRLCAMGAEHGTLVWALRQTAGRGRLSRTWVSPPGNLYVSLILRPDAGAAKAVGLTFAAALAVAEAVETLLGGRPLVRCKWPNDVLVSGRKIAGILLESATTASGLLEWVVIGIGLNVASHPPDSETIYPATSLRAEGAAETDVEAALSALCGCLDRWLRLWAGEGFAPIRSAWLQRAHGLGEPVTVNTGEAPLSGIFRGLDEDGALILDDGGARRRVTAGDVLPGQAHPPLPSP